MSTPPSPPAAATPPYRWPAEWEPLDAVWVIPPDNPETWPGCLDQAQSQHAAWCDAMREVVTVRTPGERGIATDDAWIRDFGPLFVWDAAGKLVVQDFRFNGWGQKYEDRPRDDALTGRLAEALGLACLRHDGVLEGGALDTDGRGTLLTTTQCLLHPNRNGPTDPSAVEHRLQQTLGITRIVWLDLPAGTLPGDDTDGHVDNAARFLRPCTVAVHPRLDVTPLRHAGLEVVVLPEPAPLFYDYPADRFGPAKRMRLPCSYANFLIANGRIFVPTFGQPTDDPARRRLDEAMPHHTPVPVRAEHLVVGQGALHCLSMQQPAPPPGKSPAPPRKTP
ncbi:MAG: agmatine deiminase family protein [Planctomycetota bacterium]